MGFLSSSNSCVCTCARSQYSVLNNFHVFFEFVRVHVRTFTGLGIEWVSCLLGIRPCTRAHIDSTWYYATFPSFFKHVRVHVHSTLYQIISELGHYITAHFITGHFIMDTSPRGRFITQSLNHTDTLSRGKFSTRPLDK